MNLDETRDELRVLARQLAAAEQGFQMRRRLNPHHPEEDKKLEEIRYAAWAYEKLCVIKCLYAQHREELRATATLPDDKKMYESLERCLSDDLERTIGLSTDEKKPPSSS